MSTLRRERGGPLRAVGSVLMTKTRRAPRVRTARVTVLFADLRGYTGMAERLPAARVLPLLDEFFSALAVATAEHQGAIYHMAGDGMMAGFGVHDDSDGARLALAAGHAMLRSFAPIATRWHKELAIEAGVGIGLHLGDVAVGAMGPPRQKSTTLVGDTVNVAARLCSRARAGELLLSCAVADALEADKHSKRSAKRAKPFLQLPQFELRGRSSPIDIWCVPAAKRLAV